VITNNLPRSTILANLSLIGPCSHLAIVLVIGSKRTKLDRAHFLESEKDCAEVAPRHSSDLKQIAKRRLISWFRLK